MADPTGQQPPAAFALQHLGLTRAPVVGLWYADRNITLDGFKFTRCRFDRCSIWYITADFEIEQCFFSNCTVYHPPAAVKMIRLYHAEWPPSADQYWAAYAPIRNADGTISVHDRPYPPAPPAQSHHR